MNPFDVILRPVLSEKSDAQQENLKKYTFHVHPEATKFDVRAAVKKMFDVDAVKINTCITRGKMRRRGMYASLSPKVKKAVITLKTGQTIKLFDN